MSEDEPLGAPAPGKRLASTGRRCGALLGIGTLGLCSAAWAQERPSEDELFGGPANPSPAASAAAASPSSREAPASDVDNPNPGVTSASDSATAAPGAVSPGAASPPETPVQGSQAPATPPNPAASAEASRDARILGGGESAPMFTEEAAPDDPLRIGGQLYLRLQSTASEGQSFRDFSFGAPSLLDVYLDARPNDRVRAFARGRMLYDPTLPAGESSANTMAALPATGSTSGSPALSSLFQSQTRDPRAYLDQMWIKFDVAHRLFVTAGKQHVRWGTGRFWAPTDYLHLRPRNPLDVFDARTGTSMVKLHLPIESRQWNFYAYGVTEGPDATQTLGRLAGAVRAEFVLGTTELGLGVFGRKNGRPRFAADLSTGIGDFDFYGEVALRDQNEVDRLRYEPNAVIPDGPAPPSWQTPSETARARLAQIVDALYPVYRERGIRPQAVGGVNYSRKYHDNDVFTIGAEYFYNSLGYSSPTLYPGLVLPHSSPLSDSANFFYLGRHYGALFFSLPAPYSLDTHTFTLSTIGNLSDRSFITRLDYSLVVLTHVRFEAFVSGRYGNEHGEFRFGIRNLDLGGFVFSRAPAFMDFGLALRVAI